MSRLALQMETAIETAARQNQEFDRWNTPESHCPWSTYLEEARYLLEATGENWIPSPEYNAAHPEQEHPHIVLAGYSPST